MNTDQRDRFSVNIQAVHDWSGLSGRAFEKKVGWTNGYLKAMTKSGNISADKLADLFNTFPEISQDWFFFGEGEVKLKSDSSDKSNTDQQNILVLIDNLESVLNPTQKDQAADLINKIRIQAGKMMGEHSQIQSRLIALLDLSDKFMKDSEERLKKYD